MNGRFVEGVGFVNDTITKKRAPLTPGPEPSQAALAAQERYRAEQRRKYSEKIADGLKAGVKPKAKRKAAKKR